MGTDEFAIETEGLTRRFGDSMAVADLILRLPAGIIFGFLVPDGAGKTTTGRRLAALTAPSGGTALVMGHRLGERDEALRLEVCRDHGRHLLRRSGTIHLDEG